MTKSIFNKDVYLDPNGVGQGLFYFTRGTSFTEIEGAPSILRYAGFQEDGRIVFGSSSKITDSEVIQLNEWKKANKIKELSMEILAKHLPKSILNYVGV